jgi:hypothetical protein
MIKRIPNILPYFYAVEQFGQRGDVLHALVREIA